jgi:hypothetical protein
MNEIVQDLIYQCIISNIDHILIYLVEQMEHQYLVIEVVHYLKQYRHTRFIDKYEYSEATVEFLGYGIC